LADARRPQAQAPPAAALVSSTGPWLPCEHFDGDVVVLARDLVGRSLRVASGGVEVDALIVETEAYAGAEDPASHAAFRPGGRAAIMREAPGMIYVYAAYGMYPCLNIVTGPSGYAAAVLVRGVWLHDAQRPVLGPGRVSRALGVTLRDHGASCCGERFAVSCHRYVLEIRQTPRIGITRGVELPWRFIACIASGRAV
jgi:DNA-3-methyladenine glycosylase